MTRSELLLVLNALRTNEPHEQAAVPEWAHALAIVARELADVVGVEHEQA